MRIVLLPVFILLTSLSVAHANSLGESVPYYGHDFNSSRPQLKDDELKQKLKQVLKSAHVTNSVQAEDQLVPSCDSGSNRGANMINNCKVQTSLGYDRAREFLFGKFYLLQLDQGVGIKEMYCDRTYTSADFKSGMVMPGAGIVPDGTVINTEHTWPQSRFNSRVDKEFQKSDLHHLFPTDSQMNSLRGNTIFGEVIEDSGKTKCTASKYGKGQGTTRDVFEPPHHHKGHVARAIFYFSIRYDLGISEAEEVVLKRWNRDYPVDDEESLRNNTIFELQGNRNPFIDYPELADQVADF